MSARSVTRKLIDDHLVEGRPEVGEEIALRIDQTLTHDASGTLAMLELEALEIPRVRTQVSALYVDHHLLEADRRDPDDHLYLESACRRFGIWFSPPGNGLSHPLHMERFGAPGKTLLGSDSHTGAAGALGMLALGVSGLDLALAMAGEPFRVRMPEVWGLRVTGALPDWVSAKDAALELLRRHGVDGGIGKVLELYGPGLAGLSVMDRLTIAVMGAELGALTTVFPSDLRTRDFLEAQGRGEAWRGIEADPDLDYDRHDELDLSTLEPLIACPSSPGNVVPVREVAGRPVYQAYLGSSANPGLRDFMVPAAMVAGRHIAPGVSFDVNPSTRRVLECLIANGDLGRLVRAGARLHQSGCNGCIGMGQAPASGRISLRTVPRNSPGRSGTHEDQIYLCSPETAAAAALKGVIVDPRDLALSYPEVREPGPLRPGNGDLRAPPAEGGAVALVRGPDILPLPELDPLPDELELRVLVKAGDDLAADEILPVEAQPMPPCGNIPELSRHCFARLDPQAHRRAWVYRPQGSALVAGENCGQGTCREQVALALRYLNVRLVLAGGFAPGHWQTLASFGVLPLRFAEPWELGKVESGDLLILHGLREALGLGRELRIENRTRGRTIRAVHDLTEGQLAAVLAGGSIALVRSRAQPGATGQSPEPTP
jgi:aconitate hydratase